MAGDEERWVTFHGAFGGQSLVRLRETAGRWIVTAVVVVDTQVDSQAMKMAGASASFISEAVNANPAHFLAGSLVAKGLDKAIAHAIADAVYEPPGPTDRERLTRPDGSDPDAYYRQVAEAYADAVRLRRSPADALAEEAGVPIATARGWIREARRRGALAPGRRKAS